MKVKISPQQLREIGARSYCDHKTVRRVYNGEPCREGTYLRVIRAASELGHPVPPDPADGGKAEQ